MPDFPTPADLAAIASRLRNGNWNLRSPQEMADMAADWIDAYLAAATREPPTPAVPADRVTVPNAAIEWLKKHYPVLCEKSGLCERIGGRLYTRTFREQAVATQRQPIVPEGWKLTHIQEREAGLVDIGHRDEDGVFYDVVTVDTANYFQPEAAMPIARAIVAALAAPVASERDSMVPSPSAQPYGWVIDGELVTEGNAYPADLERFKRLGTPVYLAQPAELKERKPLTDMEALSLVKSPPRTWGGVLALTRAIERAHGIQEQPKESK
jgi:hypothetical protein